MSEKRTGLGQNWAMRWRSAVQRLIAQELSESRNVSSLRITRLEIDAGLITADVFDGSLANNGGECHVTIHLPEWTDEQWSFAIELLGRQALYTAQLLAGELPADLEPMLAAEGLSLTPESHESIRVICDCGETEVSAASAPDSERCYHVVHVLHDAAEMVDEDPWLLFLLRGRRRQQVLRMLRRSRGGNSNTQSDMGSGHTPQMTERDAPRQSSGNPPGDADVSSQTHPLEDDVDRYWGSSREQEQFRPHIFPPIANLILLRRLGPPAFSHANAEVYDKLSSVYHRVTEEALALAYAEDAPPDDSRTDAEL